MPDVSAVVAHVGSALAASASAASSPARAIVATVVAAVVASAVVATIVTAVIASAISAGRLVSMDVPAFTQPLTDAETGGLAQLLNDGLDQGGLGIGVLLDYMSSAVSDAELQLIFDVAAKRAAPVFVHIRVESGRVLFGAGGGPAGTGKAAGLAPVP